MAQSFRPPSRSNGPPIGPRGAVDTVLEVYPAPCNTGSIFPIDCNDDTCGLSSQVSFIATAGAGYVLRVSRFYQGFGFPTVGGAGTITRYCPADFDLSGTRSVDDIFIFINAWFVNDPRCDFDGIPGISIDDLFVFINAWFAGCD